MTRLIIALLIKDHKNTQSPLVRTRYGMVSGIVGLVCNTLLSAVKFFLGAMSGSIAVTADAVNNLSDCGSSAVTLIGFKMASKPADNEHPYGHGRIEYIAGLIVSFMIMYAGFEILKSSVIKIVNPMPVASSLPVIIGLCASILVKLWLNRFNNTVSKRISSSAVSAAAADSVFDMLATGATLVSVIVSGYTDLPMDGIAGILVSAIILYAGVGIIRDTLSPLLGRSPSPELVGKIKDMVLSYDGILGVHDLIVHEYGPGKVFASLHAEVSVEEDVLESHALIDGIENELSRKLGIDVVIHMDPLENKCELTNELKRRVTTAVSDIDERFRIHDFRVVPSGDYKNLVFDVEIPIEYKAPNSVVEEMICEKVKSLDVYFVPKIMIDRVKV